MPYAVELHFDDESRVALVALSTQIQVTCGGMDLVASGGAPHLSLALFAAPDLARLQPLLMCFAQQVASFPLSFAAVGTFPGSQGVLYLAPVVTLQLLTLHRDFHAQLAAAGLSSNVLYQPDRWVPHCTVGFRLPVATIGHAVALCRAASWPTPVSVSAIRLVEFSPQSETARGESAQPGHKVEILCHYQLSTLSGGGGGQQPT